MNLEQLIGKMAFGGAAGESAKSAPKAAAATAGAVKTETIISTDKTPGGKPIVKTVPGASPIETPKPKLDLKKTPAGNATE